MSAIVVDSFATQLCLAYNKGVDSKNIGWGKSMNIESAVLAYIETQAQADVFSGQELLALGQAEAVEYVEKQFNGPAMSDDDWASL